MKTKSCNSNFFLTIAIKLPISIPRFPTLADGTYRHECELSLDADMHQPSRLYSAGWNCGRLSCRGRVREILTWDEDNG